MDVIPIAAEAAPGAPLTPLPAIAPDGSVQLRLPCRRCGYELLALPADANCPECDLPIKISLRPMELAYGEPSYVAKLLIGAFVTTVSPFLLLASMINFGVYSMAHLVVCVVIVLGVWLATTPDPSGLGEDLYGRRRGAVRWLIFAAMASFPLSTVLSRVPWAARVASLSDIISAVAWIAGPLGMIGTMSYLSALSRRVGSKKVWLEARMTMWLLIASAACLGIGVVSKQCQSRFSVRLMPDRLANVAIGVGVPMLFAAGVTGLIAGWRLTTALSLELQAAKHFWKAESLPASAAMVMLKHRE